MVAAYRQEGNGGAAEYAHGFPGLPPLVLGAPAAYHVAGMENKAYIQSRPVVGYPLGHAVEDGLVGIVIVLGIAEPCYGEGLCF